MSEIKITIQNDNKDEQKSDLPKQASPHTAVYMHAPKNEEEDVCRTVLYKEEEHETRGEKVDANSKVGRTSKDTNVVGNKEYVVCYGQNPQGTGYPPPYGAQSPQAPQSPFGGFFGQQNPPPQQGPQSPFGGFFGQQNPPPPPGPQNAYEGYFGQANQQQGQQPTHPVYMSGPPFIYDEETEDRNSFVRKVTLLTLILLLLTAGFVAVVLFIPEVKMVFITYRTIFLIASAVGLMVLSCVMPTAACARQSPTNYVCLLIALVFQSLFLGVVTCIYQTHILLQALVATLVVVAICVVLACSSFDFTKMILYVIAIGVALSVLTIMYLVSSLVFNFHSKPLFIALLVGLTLLSVVTLIMDLQMILGGKSIQLSEDDYALGAFMLYMSIVDIFVKLVILLYAADS